MTKLRFTIKDPFGNDINFTTYQLNGKTVTRRSAPPNKQRINNDPAFHKQKMNSQEFAAAAILGKAFRNQDLKETLEHFKDTYMSSRLTGACLKIIQKGSGEHGKREACIATNGSTLEQFPLHKNKPLSYSFKAPYNILVSPNRDTITLQTSLSKAVVNGQPKTATHAIFTLALATVSKHTYNNKTKSYQPEHPNQNGIGVVTESQPIKLTTSEIPVQIELKVPGNEPLANTTGIVVALGITFGVQEHNAVYGILTGKAMNIIKIL